MILLILAACLPILVNGFEDIVVNSTEFQDVFARVEQKLNDFHQRHYMKVVYERGVMKKVGNGHHFLFGFEDYETDCPRNVSDSQKDSCQPWKLGVTHDNCVAIVHKMPNGDYNIQIQDCRRTSESPVDERSQESINILKAIGKILMNENAFGSSNYFIPALAEAFTKRGGNSDAIYTIRRIVYMETDCDKDVTDLLPCGLVKSKPFMCAVEAYKSSFGDITLLKQRCTESDKLVDP